MVEGRLEHRVDDKPKPNTAVVFLVVVMLVVMVVVVMMAVVLVVVVLVVVVRVVVVIVNLLLFLQSGHGPWGGPGALPLLRVGTRRPGAHNCRRRGASPPG